MKRLAIVTMAAAVAATVAPVWLFLGVFAVGWFGMGFEVAGAKLVLPILGGNHIVWSLIFTTFIAAMGIGGWAGGRIADRWPRIETVVYSLLALAAVGFATVSAETRLLPSLLGEAGAVVRLVAEAYPDSCPLAVDERRAREMADGTDGAVVLTDRFAPLERFVWGVVFKAADKRAERLADEAGRLVKEGRRREAFDRVREALAQAPELPSAIKALRAYLDAWPGDDEAVALLKEQASRKSAGWVAKSAYASVLAQAGDFAETAELKRIVAGLKEESKMMSASGRTFEEAIAYFVAQQEMEARYREAILSRDSSVEEKNRLLSAIGLETIPTAGD